MQRLPTKLFLTTGLLAALGTALPAQTMLQKLTATGGVVCEQFGHGIAMSGNRIVVGAAAAPDDPPLACANGAGAAYVFDKLGPTWTQQVRLVPPDGGSGDEFGNSVAVWGDRIVVGSEHHDGAAGSNSGAAYVFELQGGVWTQVAKLEPSDAEPSQYFARSVSISGDWIVCGARFDNTLGNQAGAAWTFQRNGSGAWVETQKIFASDGSGKDLYGNSVSIDGDTLVAGAYFAVGPGGNKEGKAYVYELQGGVWVETQILHPNPPNSPAEFGRSVSISGDQILVGARADGGPGAAYVFKRTAGVWSQTARLTPSVSSGGDQFGESVGIHGDDAVVGARVAQDVQGMIFLYQRQGSVWVETAPIFFYAAPTHGWFGYNVAISTGGAVGGAPFDLDAKGSAGVYSIPAGVGGPLNYCTAGTSASGCAAQIDSSGTASASASSGFNLLATQVEGAKDGLFFFGSNGRQATPWGNGTSFQCVVPPVRRAGLLVASGTLGLCDGSFLQDMNALWCPVCPKPLKNPGAGATVQAQLWYRDPFNTSNQTTSLSNAIEFGVVP